MQAYPGDTLVLYLLYYKGQTIFFDFYHIIAAFAWDISQLFCQIS
mgnify:CR=1 FL=1